MIKNRVAIDFEAKFLYNKNTIDQHSNVIRVGVTKKYVKLSYFRAYRWDLNRNVKIDTEKIPLKEFSYDAMKGSSCYKILNKTEKKVFNKWLPIISLMFCKKNKVDHDKESC